MTSTPPERRRADAQRNRARILEVASEAFTADPDVSLNAIAKQAGIGPGTLYRHFPTRDALLLGVYGEEIASLGASVQRSLQSKAPIVAFRDWARRLAALLRVKHGLGEALSTPTSAALYNASYGPVIAAIADLLRAGADRGELRTDVDPDDVLMQLSVLWRVPRGAAGLAQADRILEMIIDGLRPRDC